MHVYMEIYMPAAVDGSLVRGLCVCGARKLESAECVHMAWVRMSAWDHCGLSV